MPADAENILVRIAADNGIWIDGRLVDPRATRAITERLHSANPQASLVIQAHAGSANKAFVLVMASSRQAGFYDISMAAGEGQVCRRTGSIRASGDSGTR